MNLYLKYHLCVGFIAMIATLANRDVVIAYVLMCQIVTIKFSTVV